MDNRPIGIFDSGIGGLTVLNQLEENLPNESYIYFGDTLNFPYGEKTKEEIVDFSKHATEYLIQQNAKVIIIACGTATSQALEEMRELFNIPILGIIEPTVDYIKTLKLKKVGVMATTGTIRSGAWENSLRKKIPNIEVINRACPLLASIAEEGKTQTKEGINAIHEYMQVFQENDVDSIILGCTHYKIFSNIIKNEMLYPVKLIDVGTCVANELNKILVQNSMQNETEKVKTKIMISKAETDFDKKATNILKSAKKLDINIVY